MFPKINPKQMEKAMKKMGVKQEEIPAIEVIIKTEDKELVIKNPQVMRVNMMGQESLQITGDIEERDLKAYKEEDVKTVVDQAGCSEEEAKEALEKSKGDLAEAILSLQQ
ncbi:MAG: nascent polypeptide-associated complex protein [Nanoarchaeota archaeon]|nr:nascent polypeptide-associated complex protein [Nanoarchaeota archaeon]MCG2718981.1 nascent polypeptide-associated complex protein [Nanoarchaeota archaeon]